MFKTTIPGNLPAGELAQEFAIPSSYPVRLVCHKCLRMPIVHFARGLRNYQITPIAKARRCDCGSVGMGVIPAWFEKFYAKFDKQGYVPVEVCGKNKPWKADKGWIKPVISYDGLSKRYICRYPRNNATMLVIAVTPQEAYAAWLENWIAGWGQDYKEQM